MQQFTITIGWTKSDRATGYSSFDGYKPGAKQHTETFDLDFEPDGNPWDDAVAIAEAAFHATNAPFVTAASLAGRMAEAISATGYHGEGAHYSLSVGDTVTINGEVMLACGRMGWDRVSNAPAEV